jgi:hypothetical protein
MRLGSGAMRVGTVDDLRDVYAATCAILDWDRRIDAVEADDEIDVTITSTLPAIPGFVPAMTAQTTLRLNPYVPEGEPVVPPELNDFLQVLFEAPPKRSPRPQKKSPRSEGAQGPRSPAQKTSAKPTTRQVPPRPEVKRRRPDK